MLLHITNTAHNMLRPWNTPPNKVETAKRNTANRTNNQVANLSTLERHGPCGLREPLVPADGNADLAKLRVENLETRVPRVEVKLFLWRLVGCARGRRSGGWVNQPNNRMQQTKHNALELYNTKDITKIKHNNGFACLHCRRAQTTEQCRGATKHHKHTKKTLCRFNYCAIVPCDKLRTDPDPNPVEHLFSSLPSDSNKKRIAQSMQVGLYLY